MENSFTVAVTNAINQLLEELPALSLREFSLGCLQSLNHEEEEALSRIWTRILILRPINQCTAKLKAIPYLFRVEC